MPRTSTCGSRTASRVNVQGRRIVTLQPRACRASRATWINGQEIAASKHIRNENENEIYYLYRDLYKHRRRRWRTAEAEVGRERRGYDIILYEHGKKQRLTGSSFLVYHFRGRVLSYPLQSVRHEMRETQTLEIEILKPRFDLPAQGGRRPP